ncbi:hypothetical protein D3C76_1218960 [compost metagenome]
MIRTHRQHAAGKFAVEIVYIGVTGQYQLIAVHFAPVRAGNKAIGGFAVIQHLALLENLAAGLFDGIGKSLGEFQRVEVTGFGVIQRGEVARAVDPLADFVLADDAHLAVAPFLFGLVAGFMQLCDPALLHGSPEAAGAVVDIEAVALRQVADLLGRPAHAVP